MQDRQHIYVSLTTQRPCKVCCHNCKSQEAEQCADVSVGDRCSLPSSNLSPKQPKHSSYNTQFTGQIASI